MGRASRKHQEKRHEARRIVGEPYASFTERASEDDRLWFEAHPLEIVRIRSYMVGEILDHVPPTDYKVMVVQVEQGIRTRQLLSPQRQREVEALLQSGFTPSVSFSKDGVSTIFYGPTIEREENTHEQAQSREESFHL